MMDGVTELAKMLKDRENNSEYAPYFGRILELPNLKIAVGDKIILTSEYIKSLINIYATDENGRYIYVGKEVVLLPYNEKQEYILIGVVQ